MLDGLVDAEGREAVVADVAATPRYEPHKALYYEAEAFEESGIGLVHLPVPGEEATLALPGLERAQEPLPAPLEDLRVAEA